MSNQLLEHEEIHTHAAMGEPQYHPSSALLLDENPTSSHLVFEWRTDDEDSDCLIWQGDIDGALGLPPNGFPRTFSGWLSAVYPDDQDPVLNAIETHLRSNQPYSIECRAQHADGHLVYWVHSGTSTYDQNGVPISFIGTLHAIPAPTENGVDLNSHNNGHHSPTTHNIEENTDLESNVATATQEEPVTEATDTPEESNLEGPANEEISDALQAEPEQNQELHEEATVEMPSPVIESEPEISSEQRERAEQNVAQSLLRAAAHLNAQLDLEDVCEAICEEAARTIGAPSAVMLFNKSRDAFVPSTVRGMPIDYEKRYIPTPRSVYEGHVAEMGTLFLFTDAQSTPDLPNHQLYLEVDMRTIGIASLIREGEVLGLLKIYSFGETRTFTPNELAFLQGLADLGAQAIANARLLADSERRLANLNALRQIDKAILGSSDVNLVLGVVIEQVISRLGADASSALLLDPHTRMLRFAVGRGFRTNTPRHAHWQLGEGMAGRAALERRLIHVPDLRHPHVVTPEFPSFVSKRSESQFLPDESHTLNPRTHPFLRREDVLLNEGFFSYHGVPLIANGQVKGVLEVWYRSQHQLDEEKLEFLETLAGQAAIAVDNATLFRELQRSNDELALAYDSTLAGWSGALDLRDKETEGHSERVTRETLRLAREMGASAAELVNIRRGALLHDIGKMGIPDAILLKPGPLTDEEWVIMKKHPSYALELLSPIEYLRPALDIPYAHHEKWDGTGYPRGLSGEQIPLHARMFAVVDVWDALCSDRPYRKGWPIERVLNHIREASGTHFDPAVVDAFLRLYEHEATAPQTSAQAQAQTSNPESAPTLAVPAPLPSPVSTSTPVSEAQSNSKRHRFSWLGRMFAAVWGWGGAD